MWNVQQKQIIRWKKKNEKHNWQRKTRLIITNKFTWLVLNSKHPVASGFLLVTFCVFFFYIFFVFIVFFCIFLLIFFIIFLLGSCKIDKNCMVQNMCSPHYYFSPQCLIFYSANEVLLWDQVRWPQLYQVTSSTWRHDGGTVWWLVWTWEKYHV